MGSRQPSSETDGYTEQMQPRTRGGGLNIIRRVRKVGTAVGVPSLLTAVAVSAPAVARPAISADVSAVSPFFAVPFSKQHDRGTLTRLSVSGLTPKERVTSACSVCGRTRLVMEGGSSRITLRASRPLRMRASTRIIVGVTYPGAVGRWIVIGFKGKQYTGLGHGCMQTRVRSLTAAEAAAPRTIPSAPCFSTSPSPPGTEYVLWKGTGGPLFELKYDGQSWLASYEADPTRLGSAPTVVVHPDGERDVFWQGTDRKLWVIANTGFWDNPIAVPGAGTLGSAPSAVVDARGVVRVFWRGTNGPVWELSDAGGFALTATELNTGHIRGAPAVVARPDGAEDLFWQGTDGRLWEMRTTWRVARPLAGAGPIGSAPTAILDPDGVEHVFWKGTNGPLYELSDPGGHWSPVATPLSSYSGTLGSAPSAVIHPDGVQDVFWEGTDDRLWEMVWYSGVWHLPSFLPGAGKLGSRPTAALGR